MAISRFDLAAPFWEVAANSVSTPAEHRHTAAIQPHLPAVPLIQKTCLQSATRTRGKPPTFGLPAAHTKTNCFWYRNEVSFRSSKNANRTSIMPTKAKRAALYLRVSTDGQTTDNQRRVLEEVAVRRGWSITATYADAGISGTKGRDKRPGFDAMLKDASRRRFDVLMFWSIDRLGRSTAAVASALAELDAAGVAIYADKEAVDATTPHGKAMLQMAAVFAELERAMIRERVIAGLARVKAEIAALPPGAARPNGKKAIGRPQGDGEGRGGHQRASGGRHGHHEDRQDARRWRRHRPAGEERGAAGGRAGRPHRQVARTGGGVMS